MGVIIDVNEKNILGVVEWGVRVFKYENKFVEFLENKLQRS